MLSLSDQISRSRRLGRRDFMRIGTLGMGGAALGMAGPRGLLAQQLLKATTGKSVVFLFQQGGPTQHETFDPKMDAPSGVATVGGDVATSVPGTRFGSSLSKLAPHAHRMAVIRNYQTNTQHGGVLPIVSPTIQNASIGAVYSRIAGTNDRKTGLPNSMFMIPQSIDAEQKSLGEQFGKFDATGVLGKAFTPFMPGGKGPLQQALKLSLPRERIEDRQNLLFTLDNVRRRLDNLKETDGVYGLNRQAMELVLKGVADAFDLSKEDPRTVARYDTSGFFKAEHWTDSKGKAKNNLPWYTAHTKTLGKMLLLARRLWEAGCGFITIHSEFVWDFHSDVNNVAVEQGKPLVIEPFDHAVSAFIEDVEARGLSDDILLVCCGEMGRTPKINKLGGRDHWPRLAPLMLYGGGLTDGQLIGRSTRDGGEAVGRPQRPDDLLATIFHTLIDYSEARLIPDLPSDLKNSLVRIEDNRGVLGQS